MLHKLAEDISFYLITNNIIDIEDREIYIYGLELLISTLFTSISILILGFLIGNLIFAVTFLLVHFFLKSYTGGYHAKHYYECYIYSILVFIVLIIIKNITLLNCQPIIGLFSLFTEIFFARFSIGFNVFLTIIIIEKMIPTNNIKLKMTKIKIPL